MYFGNTYHSNAMYKICIIVPTLVISTSAHSSTLWHYRFGHVNFMKTFSMKMIGLLSNFGCDKLEKREVFLHAKITRNPFPNVTWSTNLLDLIHSDACDFKSFMIRDGMTSSPSSMTIIASTMCTYWSQKMNFLASSFSLGLEWRSNLEIQ